MAQQADGEDSKADRIVAELGRTAIIVCDDTHIKRLMADTLAKQDWEVRCYASLSEIPLSQAEPLQIQSHEKISDEDSVGSVGNEAGTPGLCLTRESIHSIS